jgi:hypothetical protein
MSQRLWNAALAFVRLHPLLFFPLIRLRTRQTGSSLPLLTRETELVIEGFWRSSGRRDCQGKNKSWASAFQPREYRV